MARRKQGGFELIAATPWPVGIVLGILAYFGVRYGFTLLAAFTGNPILSRLAVTTQNSDGYKMLAWMALGMCWIAALASFIGRQKRKRLLETQTGLDSLRAMSWREFEMLVGEAFRRQGYRIEETGLGGADGGIDLRLSKDGKTTLVQCKQWRSQRVDVKVVREMYGLLAHHGADAVKIVAIGDFTSDAQRFAQGKSHRADPRGSALRTHPGRTSSDSGSLGCKARPDACARGNAQLPELQRTHGQTRQPPHTRSVLGLCQVSSLSWDPPRLELNRSRVALSALVKSVWRASGCRRLAALLKGHSDPVFGDCDSRR